MMQVTLLGCGGTMPLPSRALSSAAVTVAGRNILFDCGEGTQTACRRHHVSLYKTDVICLTHYHGDHIFGLTGFLQSMGNAGRTDPVTITGPKGLREVVAAMMALCKGLPFALVLCENPEALPLPGGALLYSYPMQHRVECIGYRVQLPRAGRFDPDAACTLGVPQRDWKRLQSGQTVTTADGSVIRPQQVLGPARPGLAVAFCTDTRPCAGLAAAAQNADLLLCDATYGEDAQQDKAVEFGHCTWREAARAAAEAGAKRLWLTHYSAAIEAPEQYLPAAQAEYPAAEAGFDGKTLTLSFAGSDPGQSS